MPPSIHRELLRRLPKAELHCHLDGSVRPATLLELADEYGQPLPSRDVEELRDFMRASDARSLEDYLARFDTTLSVMQTADALERIAYELAEDAARDGVRYIEVRFAPLLNVRGGLSLGDAVEAPLAGLARAEHDHGISGRLILCALRHLEPERSLAKLGSAKSAVLIPLSAGGHPVGLLSLGEERSWERRPLPDEHVELAEPDPGEHVREAVVVAELDVVVLGARLARLRGPVARAGDVALLAVR